jgi:hypothetical protein
VKSSTREPPVNTYLYRRYRWITGRVVIKSARIEGPEPSALPVFNAITGGLSTSSRQW